VNRIFAQEGIYRAFAERFSEAVRELQRGQRVSEGVRIGPLINLASVEKVEEHISDATSKGATVAAVAIVIGSAVHSSSLRFDRCDARTCLYSQRRPLVQ